MYRSRACARFDNGYPALLARDADRYLEKYSQTGASSCVSYGQVEQPIYRIGKTCGFLDSSFLPFVHLIFAHRHHPRLLQKIRPGQKQLYTTVQYVL